MVGLILLLGWVGPRADEPGRVYEHRLRPIESPRPILADHPTYVAPIEEVAEGRWEAPPLIVDDQGTLEVRSWRFSYNARGIIEMTHRLDGGQTAIVVVHPWGVDDGGGWVTPEPAGAAFQCTPRKNRIVTEHLRDVVNPLLARLRPAVKVVSYSLPLREDPIRQKIYRSVRSRTSAERRAVGEKELSAKLGAFDYTGAALPTQIRMTGQAEMIDYFAAIPGLNAYDPYNKPGYWQLPTPIHRAIDVALEDVVFYDAEGYALVKDFLRAEGIRHILLAGYNTDMCVCLTTAGYENLRQDFNVFLIGDATLATFPANGTPAHATNAAVSMASMKVFITQDRWIQETK
jgi:nicotinamidase-related amidase